ncbi:peptidoglycan-binding protein LysM [Nitratireductor aquimarinus]|uniref:Peptidoglycan-binding protein LysM n=1 Tax=Nitratireductor aquimarinus TaxID=889300 RepID=A0ABU4AIM9_9HYPH|nr:MULTISPECIES: peptidoglycan-binding protein LysM [Alphaproteobacteria]MBY6022112.1 peptidoglycan-binding protein LysM [Nitratireductor sp. DP7N14-4]MBN7757324.1 peptidoglycan-binding protein LysM [Nitratireductor aquimarinus]MBN7761264.1 peptidoglycan-binding protein LysM [Nitratireductor aquibiodomus]MBN7777140.1 peptidoglycan-binding protein LysM [Nitratireductor pacificus]MBN7780811.1 peptidoglycan-binding protein LysM [Nitratireductor pacificus]
MGIFDFVKSVGKKLGVVDEEPPAADELKKELDSHSLGTDKVDVVVEGDKVVLKGEVADQSAFEKAVVAVGNTLGISKVEAGELKVAAAEAKAPVFYTVQKGDNLWKIAEANYGKGKGAKYTMIFEANKPMLDDPDKIYPGQVLRIPDLAEA